jgi:hypothetical protein
MSRIYWHSSSGDAALAGAERADAHLAERLKDHPNFVSPEKLGPDGEPM